MKKKKTKRKRRPPIIVELDDTPPTDEQTEAWKTAWRLVFRRVFGDKTAAGTDEADKQKHPRAVTTGIKQT